ncbi:MAG: hypothetical protein IGBAC_0328 [Ignavibacteriae bacterium]|nr:MAG: hypothetical protein IGBAC_0328 [Ignavibacteriota bacterium]
MHKEEITLIVSNYIKKNFLFDEKKEVDNDISLYQSGIIDSMGTIELISFLENTYKIRFDDDELIAENFDSINAISNFLYNKLQNIK